MTFLGFKTGKRQGEDLHLTGKEKDFTIASFLKYSSKKVEVGAYSQGRIVSKVHLILGEH